MSQISIQDFQKNNNILAIKLPCEKKRFPALAPPCVIVPKNTNACAFFESGERKIFSEDDKIFGQFEAVLLRSDDIPVTVENANATSKDGFEFSVSSIFVFRFGKTEHDFDVVREKLLHNRSELTRENLAKSIFEDAAIFIRKFTAAKNASDLYSPIVQDELQKAASEGLGKTRFTYGIELIKISNSSFTSNDYDRVRSDEIENKIKLLKAKKEAERDELARLEDEKRLLHKAKLEKQKTDGILQRVSQFESAGLPPEIALIENEAERNKLIAYRNLPPDAIKALEKASQKKGVSPSGRVPMAKRILTAQKRKVVAYNPSGKRPDIPTEVYEFPKGNLGQIRSVQIVTIGAMPTLIAGAQKGVYVQTLGPENRFEEYPFPFESDSRGGVNSADVSGDMIFASHSDYGLIGWPINRPGHGKKFFENIIDKKEFCRSVQADSDGGLYFSSGKIIYKTNNDGTGDPIPYIGSNEIITSFTIKHPTQIFAGNKLGELLSFRKDDPISASYTGVRRNEVIYMLKYLPGPNDGYIIIGAKDFCLAAYDISEKNIVEYFAPERVRWIDASRQYLFAVSHAGNSVFIWDCDITRKPDSIIRADSTINDICVLGDYQ